MPRGELFINKDDLGNWQDAFVKWHLSMDDTGLSALMAPPPAKEYITNESRLYDGIRIDTSNAKVDSRNLNLNVHIKAKNKDEFYGYYKSFCEELKKGSLHIKTKYSDDVYKTVYVSCSQFTQFCQEMAFLTLKLIEPNPSDRAI